MIEEINTLIAKEVDIQVHSHEYRQIVIEVQSVLEEVLIMIGTNRSYDNLAALLRRFKHVVSTADLMPKIVEVPKVVEV